MRIKGTMAKRIAGREQALNMRLVELFVEYDQ